MICWMFCLTFLYKPHRLLPTKPASTWKCSYSKRPPFKTLQNYMYTLIQCLIPIIRPSQIVVSIGLKQRRKRRKKKCSAIETKRNLMRKSIFIDVTILYVLCIVSSSNFLFFVKRTAKMVNVIFVCVFFFAFV